MSIKSMEDPFDENADLTHTINCACESCTADLSATDKERTAIMEKQASKMEVLKSAEEPTDENQLKNSDDYFDRAIESAFIRGIFGHNDASRRKFLKLVGAGTFTSILSTMFPMSDLKAQAKESLGKLEKTKLKIGFVPITCATPIIMAEPMGFYAKYGLDAKVIKTPGWAVARDKSLSGEYDASHMLTPMPLAMTMGAGSTAEPYIMPTVENINGQAIVLHNKHKNKRNPKDWKGFRFGVPFEYSMHNLLLRYYVAEHGIDPDKDIQIRVVPPPEMVANLSSGNLDGYLSPDPFNQRAVYEGVGFLHTLTKDIWEGHPCCAFACPLKFAKEMPNTFGALFRSIIDATMYSAKAENRAEIAKAISPKNYLNQPETVVKQVLTGTYLDGVEKKIRKVPDRIDFDPFPWHSMAVWILTQMKRWGYVKGDVNYKKIAEEVYIAADTGKVMKELGYEVPDKTYENYTIMGKAFDYSKPEEYINSFAIKR